MNLPDKGRKTRTLRRVWILAGAAAVCAILCAVAIAATRPDWGRPGLLLWGTSIPVALFMGTHLAVLWQEWFVESEGTSWWQRATRGYARIVWTLLLFGSIVVLGGIWWRLLPWRE